MVVGKGRIEIGTIAAYAVAHGSHESAFRPVPNPGLDIRRDVGGIDCAKRRRRHAAAGEWPAARHGVANIAITQCGELRAALDHIRSETGFRRRGDRIDRGLSCGDEKGAYSQRQNKTNNSKPSRNSCRRHFCPIGSSMILPGSICRNVPTFTEKRSSVDRPTTLG